jgi:dTDP-4-amino-4,6-dideoxygalactose transaminase
MIPYGRQSINEADVEAVVSALRSDYLTTGPLVDLFEEKLEKIVGAPCVVVSSGTAALHCAFSAIELSPGDEVITPTMTFIATQATAAQFGAKIIFADIQPDTGNIDPEAVASAITSRTRAIVAVDFAGHPAELDELRQLADKGGIFLIEDASHSIGSSYKNRSVGSIADITTFSFFPTKNLTTAEGGAVASRNPDLLLKARRFSRQGLIRDSAQFQIAKQGPWHQEVHKFGLNYRLADVLCALGISQLERLATFKEKRSEIFHRYQASLLENEQIRLPTQRGYVSPMWHLFHIHVEPAIRKDLYRWLHQSGIGVQINYMPVYWHPVFKSIGLERGAFPISDYFYESEISLPIHCELRSDEIDFIIQKISDFF